MFLTDVSGVVSPSSPLLIGQGALDTSGNVRVSSCVFPLAGSAFRFFARVKSPEGVVQGGYATSATALSLSVLEYALPSQITQTTLVSTAMEVGTAVTAQTLTLRGPNTANLDAANIAVYLNTSSAIVSNCTVTGYATGTGVVTFIATPTVSGMNTLYVRCGSRRRPPGALRCVGFSWNFLVFLGCLLSFVKIPPNRRFWKD